MSTITLKNNVVANNEKKLTLKERFMNYLIENQAMIILGMYTTSGRVPDKTMLSILNMR